MLNSRERSFRFLLPAAVLLFLLVLASSLLLFCCPPSVVLLEFAHRMSFGGGDKEETVPNGDGNQTEQGKEPRAEEHLISEKAKHR